MLRMVPLPASRGRITQGRRRESLFWEPSHAQAFENRRKLLWMHRVVAHSGPVYPGAGDAEGRVEHDPGLDRGTRLIKPAQPREGGGQVERSLGIMPIGFDRPPTP